MARASNIAAVLHRVKDVRLEERPLPDPGEGEVLIAVKATGICGSDVHYWQNGRIGDFVVREPMVLGHESAGVVEAVGPGVSALTAGDRVAIEPGVPCRRCDQCRSGRYNLCPDVRFLATPPIDGSMAQYIIHSADFCFKLPENVSFEEGAMIEPLSVGMHACRRGGVGAGDHLLVMGAGPIGLVTLLAGRAAGATRIVVSDVRPDRLEVARSLGAHSTVLATSNMFSQEIEEGLEGLADVSIDCSGAESAVRAAIGATRPGGTVVMVGMGPEEMRLPVLTAMVREIDLRGVFRYINTYPSALELLASGTIDVRPLVTHRFPLEDVLTALEVSHAAEPGTAKVMIEM